MNIHNVSVRAGSSELLDAAQAHAIRMAKWMKGRLRGLALWDPRDEDDHALSGATPIDSHCRKMLVELESRAAAAGVPMSQVLDGRGIREALLAEAACTDLMVLGAADESQSQGLNRPVVLRQDMSLLHDLACSILVVRQLPDLINEICVSYAGGIAGKNALRLAAEIAKPAVAKLVVFCIAQRVTGSVALQAQARQYLEGFDVLGVETVEWQGDPNDDELVIQFADKNMSDLIVVGDQQSNWTERLLGRTMAENIAEATWRPVLIAR